MCGIFFCARHHSDAATSFDDLAAKLRTANTARGPDAQRTHRIAISGENVLESAGTSDGPPLSLEFFASELKLRGDAPVVQPHTQDGNVLCFNGEIFEGLDISAHENDGVKLFQPMTALQRPEEELPTLLSSIEGPYAFVYFHGTTQRLYFGRDPLGRRSLLIHKPSVSNPYLLLFSVSAGIEDGYDVEELPTQGIFSLDVRKLVTVTDVTAEFEQCVNILPHLTHDPSLVATSSTITLSKVNTTIPPLDYPQLQSLDSIPPYLSCAVDDLIYHLDRSVMLRVQNIPQSPETLGRSRVAVLFSGGIDSTIITYLAHRHLPVDEPIDLLNVAFENPRKISLQSEGNLGGLSKKAKNAKKRQSAANKKVDQSWLVPDRVTGLKEVEELRRLCPGRIWNFVEVNVPYKESQNARPTVEALMFPSRTVMDLSLAMALYFASRGEGRVQDSPDAPYYDYTSHARVLLNGLGSDELLGGYGRHRTAFQSGGWQAVIEELQLEIDRIPTRNLGRDDRVIASHGKETRHPFLSLSVVSFLAQLPVHYKMDPRLDIGLGDKMLLRLAARKLGLEEASERKKKAMQFGSHSARMETGQGDRKGDVLLQ
ncbi:hypothetical protein PLICRDRAFT_35559 [Plicaturopsis crispa FD-325 SS-3]|nr:hypothetical protein PLICRDRAFT_35559 [Plicaturopsis crispa FD-325 SS-3]